MAEETARKTLANCSAVDGLKQMNIIRKEISDFYTALNIEGIKQKYAKKQDEYSDMDSGALAKMFLDDILSAALDQNAEKTVEIIGLLAFMNKQESQSLSLSEAYAIINDCLNSQPVVDFFSSAVRLVTKDMERT